MPRRGDQPKLDAGVDPKSVLCEFFRHGQCTKVRAHLLCPVRSRPVRGSASLSLRKAVCRERRLAFCFLQGAKCRYSHDPAIERKSAKIDLFADRRDDGEEAPMEEWDQATLEAAIKQKHGAEGAAYRTDIICKHFLDAIEKVLRERARNVGPGGAGKTCRIPAWRGDGAAHPPPHPPCPCAPFCPVPPAACELRSSTAGSGSAPTAAPSASTATPSPPGTCSSLSWPP